MVGHKSSAYALPPQRDSLGSLRYDGSSWLAQVRLRLRFAQLRRTRFGFILGLAASRAARGAKRGGGGRTRTCEAMRRLIYSQLPLPLGTLPRFNGARSASPCGDGPGHGDVKAAETLPKGSRPGAFMGERGWQSQPRQAPKSTRNQAKLPILGTHDKKRPRSVHEDRE